MLHAIPVGEKGKMFGDHVWMSAALSHKSSNYLQFFPPLFGTGLDNGLSLIAEF